MEAQENKMRKVKVYLAGGWFTSFQEKALIYLESILFTTTNFDVYSPRKEINLNGDEGIELQDFVFTENCKHIISADLIIASTVDKDMGTLWETGFASAKNKPIIYTFFDDRFKNINFNLMLAASGIATFTKKSDFENFIKDINIENLATKKIRYKGKVE